MATQRTLLITGGSRGIGHAVATQALASGWQVIAIARHFPADQNPPHPALTTHCADLAQLDALPALLRQILADHPAIDALLCNAGSGQFGALEQFSPRQIRHQLDLNLTSHLLVARALLPHLKRKRSGDLIFLGSEAALRGGRNGSLYCAAKFALRGFAQALREECSSSGVRVGIINPGMVATPFFDNLDFRPGEEPDQHLTAEDVASAVLLMLNARPGAVIDEINLTPQKRVIHLGQSRGGERREQGGEQGGEQRGERRGEQGEEQRGVKREKGSEE